MIPLQGFGYAVSLAGFFWYNYIKIQKGPPSQTLLPPSNRSDYTIVSQKDADSRKGEV